MNVLLLAGGNSDERAVSLTSGEAVWEALRRLGHQVTALDPATGKSLINADGRFLTGEEVEAISTKVPDRTNRDVLTQVLKADSLKDTDVVFIALHGGSGENGVIQNLLDLFGMKYTGSGMSASALAMNKAMTKRVMASLDIPTPIWKLYPSKCKTPEVMIEHITDNFKFPVIVKPNDGGSTIGLSRVDEASGLVAARQKAGEHSGHVLVEEFVSGREMTVTIFDGRAFPIVEIIPESGLYDYEAKYTKGKSRYVAPAEIDEPIARQMQQAAQALYDSVGASGLARIDFILTDDGRFYCLELNTLPGMTSLSLSPMAVKCEGIDFDRLVDMIIDSAIKKAD